MLEKFYENKLFAVIGRLTYSVFLVNTVIQFLHAASQRSVLPNSILMNRVCGSFNFDFQWISHCLKNRLIK